MSLLFYCPYDLTAGAAHPQQLHIYTLTEHKVQAILAHKKQQKLTRLKNKVHKVIDLNVLKGGAKLGLEHCDFEKETEEIKDLQAYLVQVADAHINCAAPSAP